MCRKTSQQWQRLSSTLLRGQPTNFNQQQDIHKPRDCAACAKQVALQSMSLDRIHAVQGSLDPSALPLYRPTKGRRWTIHTTLVPMHFPGNVTTFYHPCPLHTEDFVQRPDGFCQGLPKIGKPASLDFDGTNALGQ